MVRVSEAKFIEKANESYSYNIRRWIWGKEIEIEMLRRFLEETDVEKLRSDTENRLSKGEKTQVILQLDDKGVLKVRIL